MVKESVLKHLSAEKQISVTNIPEISAIYFALLQCGYDFYTIGRSLKHTETVRAFSEEIKKDAVSSKAARGQYG